MAPAFVPGYEHDVFISYASVDNDPILGQPGRVSTLYKLLSAGLARLLGRRDFSIWMDQSKLDSTFPLSAGLEKPLQKTALLVALVSNGYLASSWCSRERKVFLETVKPARSDHSRVFVVELDRLDDEQHLSEFADYRAYKLWVQELTDRHPRLLGTHDPVSDKEYYSRVDSLAHDIASVLKKLRRQVSAESQPVITPAAEDNRKTTIYLAEPTDDLEPTWRKVKCYLEQQSIVVVPTGFLPRHRPEEYEQAVKENLVNVELFVQLLSPVAGRRVDDSETYVGLQYRLARTDRRPILQWRDVRLTEADLSDIADPDHRDLLEGSEVQAVQIEEFKQEIMRTLAHQKDEREKQRALDEFSASLNSDKFVFVVADPKDAPIAQPLLDFLSERGFPCALPLPFEDPSGTPAEIRADFERNLCQARGTVIVYGRTTPAWYRSQLTEVRKLQVQHRQRERCGLVGLYVGPPPKPPVTFRLPGLQVLLGKEEFDPHAFEPFLKTLQELTAEANNQVNQEA